MAARLILNNYIGGHQALKQNVGSNVFSSTRGIMTNKILTIGLLTMILTSCSVSTDNLPSPDELKIAIAKSISVPFDIKDTLVYDSFIGICGNSSQDQLNRYYEPHLNETPYLDVLKKQH